MVELTLSHHFASNLKILKSPKKPKPFQNLFEKAHKSWAF